MSLLPFRIQDKNRQKWIGDKQAFTLAEILVAMAVFVLIVLIIGQIFNGSSNAISQNNKSMSALDASQAVSSRSAWMFQECFYAMMLTTVSQRLPRARPAIWRVMTVSLFMRGPQASLPPVFQPQERHGRFLL